MPKHCSHIRGLKDIRDLKLTANPAYSEDDKISPFICLLSGLEMNGLYRKCNKIINLNNVDIN